MENKKYVKGFDENLKCKDYQFEIGKEYKIELNGRKLKLCSDTGFHFCQNIQQVHNFYDCRKESENRFCEIEVLGELVETEEKCCSNHIRVVREIIGQELDVLLGLERGNTGLFNAGYKNTGYKNIGDMNTGYKNTGDLNTGCMNTGYKNTGNVNRGDGNTGDGNIGRCNSGDKNSGDRNTGDWNKCDHSTGFFNTKERTITIFNVDSGMTYHEFVGSKYYDSLTSGMFILTEWIDYTEEEKKDSVIRQCICGYLKKYTYQEACQNWWNTLWDKDKEIIMSIPNFDKSIFKEITGIEV